MRGIRTKLFVIALLQIFICCALLSHATSTSAAINPQINFQGKLANPDGTNVTDGTYSIVFGLYSASSGGTAIWTETQSSVIVSSGIFQVSLGSVTPLPGSVDFNSNSIYLGVKVGADAEMTPRIQFTAAPYAFNSDKLGGINSSGYIQLGPGSVQTDVTTNPSVFLNKTGASGNILQLQKNGVDQFVVNNSGAATFSSNVAIQNTSYTSNQLLISNGLNTALPAFPATYLPTLTVRSSQTTASRPLFFGYDNGAGTGWASYITAGACGSFSQMCFDFGNVTAPNTALENIGTTLNVGGGDDGNFTDIAFKNTGTVNVNSGTAVPATDQVVIDNTGSTGVTTAGVNGLNLHYKGGAAAVEAAGMRVDYTPGTTAGGTWSGMRIVESTPAGSGVVGYGLKLEGGGAGAGTSTAVEVAAGWDIGVDVQSGGIQLGSSTTDPTAPTGNNLKVYAKTIAGRPSLKTIDSTGFDTPLQAGFGFNRIAMMTPSGITAATNTTLVENWGNTPTLAGSTFTTPALASTNLLNSVRRARITTTGVAGAIAYNAPQNLMAWRGNAAGLGGFFYTIRFSFGATTATNKVFVGMVDSTTVPTNVDPTTTTTPGKLGVAVNVNTGNLKWINNVSGTAPTTTDLGTNFAFNTTNMYELIIYSPPNGGSITYRVKNLSTNSVTADTVVSANIPANTTFLAPEYWMSNGTTGAAAAIESAGWYLESDN